jgi:hypothetical protein
MVSVSVELQRRWTSTAIGACQRHGCPSRMTWLLHERRLRVTSYYSYVDALCIQLAERLRMGLCDSSCIPRIVQCGGYLVDPASSHMLVSKIKPCMSKYKSIYTVKLRMAH